MIAASFYTDRANAQTRSPEAIALASWSGVASGTRASDNEEAAKLKLIIRLIEASGSVGIATKDLAEPAALWAVVNACRRSI